MAGLAAFGLAGVLITIGVAAMAFLALRTTTRRSSWERAVTVLRRRRGAHSFRERRDRAA
jgi:hypothetical protein